jgi:hypothetical protein
MSSTDHLQRLSPERAARARGVRRALGVVCILALGLAVLAARFCQSAEAHGDAMGRGVDALAVALAGTADAHQAWQTAEDAFKEGMGGSLFDAYPTFTLTLTTRLRSGDLSDVEAALRPVAEAILAWDLALALERLDGVRSAAGYGWMFNLINDLQESEDRRGNETH